MQSIFQHFILEYFMQNSQVYLIYNDFEILPVLSNWVDHELLFVAFQRVGYHYSHYHISPIYLIDLNLPDYKLSVQ